ncbi:alcohol dehydrogenase [Vibrio sp. 10N.286.49.C2]|uniref:potassium channel beta subunit family protein n=1 Tax=unclassified Vibrio TaxID=2614977 RepID=UPI000C833618|nr:MULTISPECIES: aldo/keto reductase [unclassified Vibrio]PMH39349.1 alcohol dehydrogenase [Vibrio sp. 10N.286.49.C2]PMH54301.1 alcohol dehydrogenase [Vibrio sp. 10N.286.49.B1]PMH80307.1 alcohol dehydrogenase [Vibrio sp. 10N.286.48.B7]
MKYRRMGNTGLQLSEVALGSWVTFNKQVDLSAAKEIMQKAYDAGINFFDNAEGYESGESERLMGQAITELGWSRDSFIVSSKVFWGGDKPTQRGLSRKHVFDACHAALKRLQVDYLDLYFCHRPDVDTPIAETVRAMHDLVSQGKVMYWGTSEWSAQQITEAWGIAKAENLIGPSMEQPQYNLLVRDKVEADYRPLYGLMGLGTTVWSPLASGLLTGKYLDGVPEDSRLNLPGYEWLRDVLVGEDNKLDQIRRLNALAESLGTPLHYLALNWCLANENVSSVILGVSRLSQLEDNLEAIAHRDLVTPEVMAKIDAILDNKPAGLERF